MATVFNKASSDQCTQSHKHNVNDMIEDTADDSIMLIKLISKAIGC